MFKNILLAFDGSEHSRKAATLAGNLARQQPEATIWAACIVDPIPSGIGEPNFSQLASERSMTGQQAIDEAIRLIGDGVDIRRELLFGSAAESIITVAETRQCDLIVMGTRGLGALRGLLLGSQTQKVVSLTNCPVLLVK
jgi:nucleotide-binding universal stress UspA family protein